MNVPILDHNLCSSVHVAVSFIEDLFDAEFVYVGDEELGSAEFEEDIGR